MQSLNCTNMPYQSDIINSQQVFVQVSRSMAGQEVGLKWNTIFLYHGAQLSIHFHIHCSACRSEDFPPPPRRYGVYAGDVKPTATKSRGPVSGRCGGRLGRCRLGCSLRLGLRRSCGEKSGPRIELLEEVIIATVQTV